MALTAELQTLEALYNTLRDNVQLANQIQKTIDSSLGNAIWESPNATTFRQQWDEFKPKLMQFEVHLADAGSAVARNHNGNANENGVHDAPVLAPVAPIG